MIIIILICVFLLLPIPTGNQVAAYNPISRSFYCTSEYYCNHEKAHYIYYSNRIWKDEKAYKEAIIIYVFTHQQDNLSKEIVGMLGEPIEEVHAEIYAKTGGNVPTPLLSFYPSVSDKEFHIINLPKGKFYYAIHNSNNR